ncbi:MAG: hypothetical protein ACOCW3_05310 [Spirochaetota bacterium]
MRRCPRRCARLSVVVVSLTIIGGCLLQIDTPGIDLMMEPAYNEQEILIPYSLRGDGSQAQARWTLSVFTGSEYELLESREIRLPSGSSGILSLGDLPEARYRLLFEMLTTRSGSYEIVPYLAVTEEFYVDRTAPDLADTVITPEGGAPTSDPSIDAWVTLQYTGSADPAFESPVRFIGVTGSMLAGELVRPPVPGEDELPVVGADTWEISLWSADPGGAHSVWAVAALVDEAGNRSDVWAQDFSAP